MISITKLAQTLKKLIIKNNNTYILKTTLENSTELALPNIYHIAAYFPPHIGGIETCVKELAYKQANLGNRVIVLTSDLGITKDMTLKGRNPTIHYLKGFELAHTVIIPSLFIHLLRIPTNSIVHVHTAQMVIPEMVMLISMLKRFRYIIHLHADIGRSSFFGIIIPIYKKVFLSTVMKKSNLVIVPTNDYREMIKVRYHISQDKISVLPNGVNINLFKKENYYLHNPIRLLYVGRISSEKNIEFLISSFNLFNKLHPNKAKLIIVGDGKLKATLQEMVRELELQNQVLFTGILRDEDLNRAYIEADIFVFPSKNESFGIVLLEAMAAGLPIIASDILGIRMLVNNTINGLLVIQNEQNFAEAIEKLSSDKDLRLRIINNNLIEVQKYSWDEITLKLLAIYKDLIYAH